MQQELTPDAMDHYCSEVLPGVLHDVCELDPEGANAIALDVHARAEAFAALQRRTQEVLMAPFIEEVFAYEPMDAPVHLKGAVAVIVRNSQLEDAHAEGYVTAGGIEAITSTALAPLSHLLAARRREPRRDIDSAPFHGLDEAYPRAWASLEALTDAYASGGRVSYRPPKAPLPALPAADEQLPTESASSDADGPFFVQSAIEAKFDQRLISQMRAAQQAPLVLFLPTLSRISRSHTKLLRAIEFFLAYGSTIVTTNYMLRTEDAWVRRGTLVQPDNSGEHTRGLHKLNGLSGVHGKIVRQLAAQEAAGLI